MFDFLKPKKKPVASPLKPYIDAIEAMSYDTRLESVFYSRESKILLVNTYSENLSELVDRVYRNELGSRVVAVNLHHYLRGIDVERLKLLLGRLVVYLKSDVIVLNNHSKNDIQELIDAYGLLKKG